MFSFRLPTYTELPIIERMDLQCFYEPWSTDIWKFCVSKYYVRMATYQGQLAGFLVGACDDEHPTQFRIMKVAVRPSYRGRGLSRDLLGVALAKAHSIESVKHLDAWVPMNFLYPDNAPWCIKGWLNKMGFRPVELFNGMYTNQGYLEDGIRWELAI